MKDGSVRTNPGVNNPDILEPIGHVDQRLNVLRFDREGGETLILSNFGMHPDSIGSNNIKRAAKWLHCSQISIIGQAGNCGLLPQTSTLQCSFGQQGLTVLLTEETH